VRFDRRVWHLRLGLASLQHPWSLARTLPLLLLRNHERSGTNLRRWSRLARRSEPPAPLLRRRGFGGGSDGLLPTTTTTRVSATRVSHGQRQRQQQQAAAAAAAARWRWRWRQRWRQRWQQQQQQQQRQQQQAGISCWSAVCPYLSRRVGYGCWREDETRDGAEHRPDGGQPQKAVALRGVACWPSEQEGGEERGRAV
jgi:hypothetical protein